MVSFLFIPNIITSDTAVSWVQVKRNGVVAAEQQYRPPGLWESLSPLYPLKLTYILQSKLTRGEPLGLN